MAISVENHKFSPPHVFNAPEGVPLELGDIGGPQETRVMGLSGREKKFDDIFSHLDIIHE